MRVFKMHCHKAERRRLQIKRREDGRGLLQTKTTYREKIMNTAKSEQGT
jgi:hypothetical protein